MSKQWLLLAVAALVVTGCDAVTGTDNSAPAADAGDDESVYVGETVTLNGSGTDPDADELTYTWALTTKPDTSSATLTDAGNGDGTLVPDVPGTYIARLTVSDGDESATDEVTVTAAWDLRLSGSISADSTLYDRGSPYTVASQVLVTGGTLTIMPGVRIEFAQGARMSVGTGGVLSAVGTATDTIRFVGSASTAGHWEGIEISSASPSNELRYVEVANAGGNGWAGVWVWTGGAIKIWNSLIRGSATSGVTNAGSLSGWSSNTLRDNVVAGVTLDANTVRYLDAASTYAGGSTPYAIEVSAGNVTTAGTWPATDEPYLVSSSPGITAALTLQPGVELAFEQAERFSVNSGGSLSAVGTQADTIRFYGTQQTAGFWEGIEVSSTSTSNELSYVEIAHAGGSGWAGLWVWSGGSMEVTHSLIRNSATVGVNNAGSLAGWSTNTLTDNVVAGLELTANTVRYLDAASTYAGGSTPYAIEVASGNVTDAGTWPATDKPYLVSTSPGVSAALTIQAGAELWFTQSERLSIGSAGSLTAEGTATDSITFRGVEALAGYWEGIEVSSLSTSNSLAYVNLGYGGGNGWANLWIWSGDNMSVSESLIHDSATCGVEAQGTYTAVNVSYANNAGGDVCN